VVNSIHAVLMGPNNHAQLVDFEELFNLIGTVAHDVVLFSRITHSVGMHAELVLAACGIGP